MLASVPFDTRSCSLLVSFFRIRHTFLTYNSYPSLVITHSQTSSVTVINFRSPQYLSSVFLNTFSDSAFTILSGRLFHVLIILFEKKCWNFLVTQWGLNNFLELVRVMQSFFLNSVLVVSLSYILCTILYVSIMSPLDLL